MFDSHCGQQAYSSLRRAWELNLNSFKRPSTNSVPDDIICESTEARPIPSTNATESDITPNTPPKDTVLYLAYGSNLCSQTFKGQRGIKPLNARNVLVPELELCFDLPGIPYNEPCFANTRLRTVTRPWNDKSYNVQYQKGLVGVVYEVTREDYAKIIASEGGGASYKDIVVLCFEMPRGTNFVKPIPTVLPFSAHTLFCPSVPTEPGEPAKPIGRISRPNPDYAQPSARYLKLITDGAAEHRLPMEYQNYLLRMQPYAVTSRRQKIGQAISNTLWLPVLLLVVTLGNMLANEEGKPPAWLGSLMNFVSAVIWMSYDMVFKPLFGDGERTQDEDGDEESARRCFWNEKKPLLNEAQS